MLLSFHSVAHSIDFHLLIPAVYNINKIAASLSLGFSEVVKRLSLLCDYYFW